MFFRALFSVTLLVSSVATARADSLKTVVHCSDMRSHGLSLSFMNDPLSGERDISSARLFENTWEAGTHVLSELNVCRTKEPAGGFDMISNSVSCHDVNWSNGYDADLFEGGLSGIPTAKVYQLSQQTGQKELIAEMTCKYVR